jgi:hypothetical protein
MHAAIAVAGEGAVGDRRAFDDLEGIGLGAVCYDDFFGEVEIDVMAEAVGDGPEIDDDSRIVYPVSLVG